MRCVTSENIDRIAHVLAVAKRLKMAFWCAAAEMSRAIHPDCILFILGHHTELVAGDSLSSVTILTAETSPTVGPVARLGLGLDVAIRADFVHCSDR